MVSMEKAMMMPIRQTAGTGNTIWMNQTTPCWIIFTSLSVRVIIDPVPNCSKSSAENASDLS